MYLIFITPILEYASEVWDNCRQINSERLERVQLEAVRTNSQLHFSVHANLCIFLSFVYRGLSRS
jgi:hypothetical protein